MAEGGVHPHVSHEIDVVKLVDSLASQASRVASEVERAYDTDATTDWREYAKQLAARIKAQRGEISRLHAKVRDLRADVHERDEQIAALQRGEKS
jgi:hypothetical protein